LIVKRDISIIYNPGYVNLVAREMVTEGVGKIICKFDWIFRGICNILLFKKGNPLLDRFNIRMRRYLEAGLPERCWREAQHRASLRGWKEI